LLVFLILGFCFGPARASEIGYTVGVHYYPWYWEDFHGGQYLRKHLVPAQIPALGEYNDRESAVVSAHLAWSRATGIDFWSASWWGPATREDVTLLTAILPHPDLRQLQIAVHYETVGRTNDFTDYSNLGPDVSYLAAHYFGHPNYLRVDGRPVLIVYLTRVLSMRSTLESSLLAMRAAAAQAGYNLYIMGDQVFGWPDGSADDIALLDGIMNYDVYGSMGATGHAGQFMVDSYYAAQQEWKDLADSVGTDYAPAVTPGFNNRAVGSSLAPLARRLAAGAEFGTLFRAMLQGAKPLTDADIGHMLFVTSWNEWHEDTQIEPLCPAAATAQDDSQDGAWFTQGFEYEGYGMKYLDILREETSEFVFRDGFESVVFCAPSAADSRPIAEANHGHTVHDRSGYAVSAELLHHQMHAQRQGGDR